MTDVEAEYAYINSTNTTNYNSCDSDIPPMSSPYFQAAIYFMYIVIFVVATFGNGLVCYIVMSSPRMRTVTNYFITNLAVGDLLIIVLCVPFTSISSLKQYWPFGTILCPLVNYSQAFAVFVSSYTLVTISIDRYMAIIWPLKPRMSKRIAGFLIFMVWLISSITVLPTLILSKVTQPNDNWYIRCNKYICREEWSEVGLEYGVLYTKVLAIFQYIVPLSVFVFTYTSIAVVLCCHRIPGEAENCRDQRIARSKRKMVKMMVTVVFVYTLCWLPFNVFWIVESSINHQVRIYLWFALHGLAMSHACYNPIIYCYMNSRFRAGILQTLGSIPCCKKWLTTVIARRPTTSLPLTSLEGTDTTLLHRDNTSTTYISMRRKNGSRITSLRQHHVPVRSASMMRANPNHSVNAKNYKYPSVLENQI